VRLPASGSGRWGPWSKDLSENLVTDRPCPHSTHSLRHPSPCAQKPPTFTRGSVTFALRRPAPRAQKPPRLRGGASPSPYATPRHAHRSPRVHAGECHLPPTSPLATRTEAPAFTRRSVTFPLRHPSPCAQKPPRLRGGVSPSPYVTPRHAHRSPRVHAGECHLPPTSPLAKAYADTLIPGPLTFGPAQLR
jgi:hypothetical protein